MGGPPRPELGPEAKEATAAFLLENEDLVTDQHFQGRVLSRAVRQSSQLGTGCFPDVYGPESSGAQDDDLRAELVFPALRRTVHEVLLLEDLQHPVSRGFAQAYVRRQVGDLIIEDGVADRTSSISQ